MRKIPGNLSGNLVHHLKIRGKEMNSHTLVKVKITYLRTIYIYICYLTSYQNAINLMQI